MPIKPELFTACVYRLDKLCVFVQFLCETLLEYQVLTEYRLCDHELDGCKPYRRAPNNVCVKTMAHLFKNATKISP